MAYHFITLIQDWTASAAINAGLGSLNTLSVTQTSPGNFDVFINGTSVTTFSGAFTQGNAGFIATVSSGTNESFPNSAVDVRFKMTAPVTIPQIGF